jgi:hypothetical protein
MQTFLPYPSFRESARCLDYRRLGKQRVECKQLLLALGVPVGEHQPKPTTWINHPAARMWRRHELSLALYGQVVCREWRERGYKDTLLDQFKAAYDWLQELRWDADAGRYVYGVNGHITYPNWIGYDRLHASHRSNLLRKDATHYGQFGWQEPADLPYWWPTQQEAVA